MNEYFEELYNQYSSMVLKAAYRILRDEYESRDVLNEVFCKLFICLGENKEIQNVSRWLCVTASTTAIDMVRKRKAIPIGLTLDHNFFTDDFVDTLIQDFLVNDILRVLYVKSPKWSEYINMHYLLGMSFEEIALVKGTSAVAVKHAIQRAKKYLFKKQILIGLDSIYPIIIILIQVIEKKI